MKKTFLTATILLMGKMAFCQAPVIDSTWLPKAGDKYYKYGSSPIQTQTSFLDVPVVPANDTGANVTWDFSSTILPPTKVDSFDFTLPATRNIPCSNQAANFASGNSNNYYCYIRNSSGIYTADYSEYIGSGVGYGIFYYTKPETFIFGNYKFREHFHDTSEAYYYTTYSHSPTDSNWHELKNRHLIYDGYGTLKIDGKVFDSVVRIHEIYTLVDSLYYGSSYTKAYTLASNYNWYISSIHVPVLTINISWQATPSGSGFDTNFYAPSTKYLALSLPANGSFSALAPPPAFKNATANMAEGYIEVHNAEGNGISYSVYDAQGKLITSGIPNAPGSDTWQIPVATLSPGVYVLKLQNNAGQTTSIKLVKDH